MTPDQVSIGCAFASMAASFGAPVLEKWRPFGASLLRVLAVLFAAAAIVVFLWSQQGLLIGGILAASLLVLAASSYAQMRRLGSLRRDAERRADEAETKAALTQQQLDSSETARLEAESKSLEVSEAAVREKWQTDELIAIADTVEAIEKLVRSHGTLPSAGAPEEGGHYEYLVRTLLDSDIFPSESGEEYRAILKELDRKLVGRLPASDHSGKVAEIERLKLRDMNRHSAILHDRSERLTKLVSSHLADAT